LAELSAVLSGSCQVSSVGLVASSKRQVAKQLLERSLQQRQEVLRSLLKLPATGMTQDHHQCAQRQQQQQQQRQRLELLLGLLPLWLQQQQQVAGLLVVARAMTQHGGLAAAGKYKLRHIANGDVALLLCQPGSSNNSSNSSDTRGLAVMLLDRSARSANTGRVLGRVLSSRLFLEDQGYHVACAPLEDWLGLADSGSCKVVSSAVTDALNARQQEFVMWLAEQLKLTDSACWSSEQSGSGAGLGVGCTA
jgi:hypothetical protein